MKFEAIVGRIGLARAAKIENIMPYDNFYDRIVAAADLLDFVESKQADKKIR